MRVLYGGSFDPVHLGHIALARHLLRTGAEVHLIVSVNPPYRSSPRASLEHRKAMLSIAFEGELAVCIERTSDYCESPYTIDLLRSARRRAGDTVSLGWAMGSDQFAMLNTWRQWRQLTDLAHLLIFAREEDEAPVHEDVRHAFAPSETDLQTLSLLPAGRVARMRPRLPQVSSTEVRARIAQCKSVDDLLPRPVRDYATAHRLYQ